MQNTLLYFQDAKTDECARRSYKMLVAFHSDCDAIYKIVEEIGVIIREVRELEDQVDTHPAIRSCLVQCCVLSSRSKSNHRRI